MASLPDLESLRCFVLGATNDSFRAAARRAALSPAAFGARIRRLEEDFGHRLFRRTTRRVALTPRGEELLPSALRCVEEAEACAKPIAAGRAAPFELLIGARFEVGVSWVVPALGVLERARPERRLHLTFGDVDELLPRLLSDEVHLVLTSARIQNPKLVFAPFLEVEYALVATPGALKKHPLAGPGDARHHRLLDMDVHFPLFRFFGEARPPSERWAFGQVQLLSIISAIRARCLEGVGVAVLPLFYVREDIAKGRLKVLMPHTRLKTNSLRGMWRKGQPYEAELRSLCKELATRVPR